MSIRRSALQSIEIARTLTGLPWAAIRMAELGNQLMPHLRYIPAKKYFTDAGVEHVSIDLNGHDGAVPLDLSEPLLPHRPGWFEYFHIVTNCGTSEHVAKNQYQVFANIDDLCRVHGVMVHVLPHSGSWKDHCVHYYTEPFFSSLAAACGYRIFELGTELQAKGEELLFVTMIKTKSGFCEEKDFPLSHIKSS